MYVERLIVHDIRVTGNRRPLNEDAVAELMRSIAAIGLRQPITVRPAGEDDEECNYILVAGHHRLEACRRLDHDAIDGFVVTWTEDEARRWEIAENLHRAELSPLERAEAIAEWIRLSEKTFHGETSKPMHPRDIGVRRASRELGVSLGTAHRAMRIASITPEAKEAAQRAGLTTSQKALLNIARQAPERQVEAVQRAAAAPIDDEEVGERQFAALMTAWNKASAEVRWRFIQTVS